jgi:predicted signal transduction protein with EAL and GGDEF domain
MQNDYEIARIAEKISSYLATPYFITNHKISYLTTSIGIVIAPKDGLDREILLKNADTAMYNAKRRGKNNFQFFSQDMTLNSVKRLKIEKNLTMLVNKNDYNNQLKIYYQPIIERLKTGEYKVIGSEALVRWDNPEIGKISPSIFIPIAEETNMIMDIGDWIFYRVCKDYQTIYENYGERLYASINLSARQLKSITAIKKMERILKELQFDPTLLQLELTETSYLDDHVEVLSNLKRFQELGIRLALDDFGVGYASLSYLHKVPAQTIKIDRSFIRFLSTSSNHSELVKSIIILGHNLKMDVVAEGVEQVEDLYLLNEHRCRKYQGHLFSMPLPLNEFIDFLSRKSLLTTLIH